MICILGNILMIFYKKIKAIRLDFYILHNPEAFFFIKSSYIVKSLCSNNSAYIFWYWGLASQAWSQWWLPHCGRWCCQLPLGTFLWWGWLSWRGTVTWVLAPLQPETRFSESSGRTRSWCLALPWFQWTVADSLVHTEISRIVVSIFHINTINYLLSDIFFAANWTYSTTGKS